MTQRIALATLLVRDYDEAIEWFSRKLHFVRTSDDDLGGGKRWVTVAPSGGGSGLLLARAADDDQRQAIGNQAGGRVAFFLHTDNFARDHTMMRTSGVTFREEPRQEAYGTVAVFEDLYGNLWDLIEPKVTV